MHNAFTRELFTKTCCQVRCCRYADSQPHASAFRAGVPTQRKMGIPFTTVLIPLSFESKYVLPGARGVWSCHYSFFRSQPTVRILFVVRSLHVDPTLKYGEQESAPSFGHCVSHLAMCSCINFIKRALLQSDHKLADDTITSTTRKSRSSPSRCRHRWAPNEYNLPL